MHRQSDSQESKFFVAKIAIITYFRASFGNKKKFKKDGFWTIVGVSAFKKLICVLEKFILRYVPARRQNVTYVLRSVTSWDFPERRHLWTQYELKNFPYTCVYTQHFLKEHFELQKSLNTNDFESVFRQKLIFMSTNWMKN